MPAAKFVKTLPGGKSGTTVPMLWAELGDAKSRWESFRHLQAEAGGVPVTKASGKSRVVQFRFACNKLLRYASYWFSFNSLNRCEWANKYYRDQRRKGTAILRPFELWERSGSRLFSSCGEIINLR